MNLFSGRRLRRVLAVLALALALLFVVRPWQGARIGPDRIPDAGAFAPGDILLLGSSTWRGRFVKTADGTLFAHVALVDVDGDGGVWLVHASPQRDRVVREPIRSYFASNEVDCAALLRVDADPDMGRAAARFARDAAARGVPFDHRFSYGTGEGVYCTELALLSWSEVGIDLLGQVERGASVYPSALAESPQCREVLRFSAGE